MGSKHWTYQRMLSARKLVYRLLIFIFVVSLLLACTFFYASITGNPDQTESADGNTSLSK